MNLDKKIQSEIIALAQKYGVKKAVLFGSRAKGTNGERSDIDIAVSGGNFFSFADDVDEKVNTLLKFDVVNLDKKISPELMAEIERHGILIYESL